MEGNREFRERETTNKGDKILSLLSGKKNPMILSLLLTGICFITIGVLGWQVSDLIRPLILENISNLQLFQTLGFVFVLTPIIASFFIYKRIQTIHSFWLVLLITLYMIGEIFGFSIIFIIHNVVTDWILAFAFSGGVFIVCGIIGYFFDGISKLWKYVAIISGLWIIMMVIMFIFRFAFDFETIKDIHLILAGVLGVLTMFYIMFDVNRMKHFQHDPNNKRRTINTILITTFRFLIDLVNLVWVFARLTFLR